MKRQLLIAGYYGFRNTGDEAILTAMLSDLRALRPDLEFVVVSGDPSATAAQYNVRSVLFTDIPGILEAGRQSDLLVLGGGGLFQDYWGAQSESMLTRSHGGIPFYSGFACMAALLGKPFMLYAVGVGPLFTDEGKRLTHFAFEQADVATVRDAESLDLVRSLGVQGDHVRITADPSFSLKTNEPRAQWILKKAGLHGASPLVGVSLRCWDVTADPENWKRQVASALDGFLDTSGATLLFVPFQNLPERSLTDDLSVAENVVALMGHTDRTCILRDITSPSEIAGILSQCEMAVGMRLHSLVFALKENVPAVGIIYDPKVASLMTCLGMKNYAVDLAGLSADALLEAMARAWANKDGIRLDLQMRRNEMKSLAQENTRLAVELVDGKGSREPKPFEMSFIRQFALKQTLQLAEKDSTVQALVSQIESLHAQINQEKDPDPSLVLQVAGIDARLQAMISQSTAMQAQLAEKEQQLQSMTSYAIGLQKEVEEKRHTAELLQMQLVAKHSELQKITNSLGWRLLSRFGPIKYRYLLPLYRLLHLTPSEERLPGGKQGIAALPSSSQEKGLPQGSISTVKNGIDGISSASSLGNRTHRDQLRLVIEKVQESRGAVIFLPSVGWKIHLAQRPHHMAREYARQGYVSIFVENMHPDEENGFTEIEPNLFVFCSPEALLKEIPDPILWCFPYNFHEKDRYPALAGTIYDWIDDLGVFPYPRGLLEKNHSRALKEATVVAAVSRRLVDQAAVVRPDALYVPNGVEYDHFADESIAIPDDPAIARLRWEGKPIAGYYGAFAKWFDYGLLDALAELRQDWNFLLIGPMYDESFAGKPLLKRSNVVWIGPRPYESLPGYLKLFDVATIPFLVNDITQATSPLKLYEYFAGGKSVVTTPMPECQAYPEVHVVKGTLEFSRALDAAKEQGSSREFREQVRRLAKENSWTRRIETVVEQLEKKSPRAARKKRWSIPTPSGQTSPTARRLPEQKPGLESFLPSCYDVICFPIIDWNFRFQRPQQLLTQFANNGHRIFYIRTTFHQAGTSVSAQTISRNIYDVQLPHRTYLNLYQDEISERASETLLNALEELRAGAGITEAVCLVQLPFWSPLALKARDRWEWKIVYDCMDEHSGFSTNNRSMLGHEEVLTARSDLVLTTSRALFEKASRTSKKNLFLPNAADFEHFNQPGPLRPLAKVPHPIIGYYGAISDWFDVEMVRAAASTRPDWQFVLIGSTFGADISSLKQLSNVHLLGEQPYPTLPGYLHQFDVACIPFLLTSLTQATNPVKFYEYLSAGKPVVAVPLPELEPYREYFYPVRSREDFVTQVEAALKEQSTERVDARIDFARKNTWPDRFEKLRLAVQELYSKVALVIVSYDNPKCLRLCLESLWAKTLYPNFEVIVVDNGSSPELVGYLQENARQEPRLKVILNGRNLGFARANNIGIQAARECDVIVLLNDDTIVARGWLSKMVRYLKDDKVGIVGPVTNWIGNEAKIAVGYQSIAGMDEFAERHMSEHEGQSFDIPMLAMFCIGMRKSLLEQIGLLDEQFGIGMFEDDDFALRVREVGYRVVCAEDIFVHHWGQASFHKMKHENYLRLFEKNRKKFERKWKKEWKPHELRSGMATPDCGKFSIEV
ncbi:MAG: polysaccharide pyruvyl transferase family protein [Acidobacteriia bacterium]|nr:polysaccharide pyruvyl transferase family protein [Terriglobia bacterium]